MAEFIEVISEQAKKDIDELVLKLSAVSKEINEINAKGKKVRFPSEAKKNVEQTARATKKLNAAEKETKRLSDAVRRQRAKYTRTTSEANKELHKLRVETQHANRIKKLEATESSELVGAYKRQQAAISRLSIKYKNLATKQQMGIKLSKREERELEDVTQQINRKQRALKRVDANIGNYQRNVGNYKSAWKGLGNIVRTAVTAFGLFSALEIGKQIFRQVKEVDKLNKSLAQTTDTVDEFNKAQKFLQSLAERSGAALDDIQAAFIKFRAAAKGSNITLSETRSIFDAVTMSLGLMGASTEDTKGALRALEQMISKGKVQAEEIRGQLGERLPGAYRILAESIGMTTEELSKQLELGNVYADEVLPKFAERLKEVYGIDNQTRVETLVAEQGRLSTAWSNFIRSVENGNGIISQTFTILLSGLTEAIDLTNKLFGGSPKNMALIYRSEFNETTRYIDEFIKNIENKSDRLQAALSMRDEAKMNAKAIRREIELMEIALEKVSYFDIGGPAKISMLKQQIAGLREQLQKELGAIDAFKEFFDNVDDNRAKETGRKIAQSVKEGLESETFDDKQLFDFFRFLREEFPDFEMPNESLQEFIDGLKEAQRNTEKLKELMAQMRVNDILRQQAEKLTDTFNVSFSKIEGYFNDYESEAAASALTTMELASGIGETMMENEQQRIANQMRLNRQMYAEMINDAQNNETQREELREERERREAQLRHKQAKEERKNALFQIAIDTATAVIKTFAEAGFPAGIPFAAAVSAMGAAQAAFVSSKPLPQYKHGREDGKEEYAILGDGGKSEAVTDKKGNLKDVSPDKPTVMKLDRGDRVIPDINDYYDDLNNKLMLANVQASASKMKKQNEQKNDAYNIEKAVVKALKKAKFVNNNNIDLGESIAHEAWKAKYK